MINPPTRQALTGSALFALCFIGLLFLRMLPLSTGLHGWPGPNIGLGLALAWVLRRPDQIPALLIIALFLAEDVMLWRPIGLWPVIVLAGTEAARRREHRWRDHAFMVEWLRVSILMGVMMLGYRLAQIAFLLPVPSLGQVILQLLATVFAYPLVVGAARLVVGLRRIGPGETDDLGYVR